MLFIRAILGFIGFVFLFISIGMKISENKRKQNCTQAVTAEVIDIRRIESTDFDTYSPTVSWYPVYQYRTGQRDVCVRSVVGGKENQYKIGQKIELYINPENPEENYCPSDNTKFIRIVLAGIGAVLLIGCAASGFFRM